MDKRKEFIKTPFKQLYLKRAIKYVYDLYGNRMPIDMVSKMINISKSKRTKRLKKESKKSNVFTASRRLDLSLPLNLNPGPGMYFH